MATLTVTIKIKTGEEVNFKNGFLKAVKRPPHLEHLTDEQFFKKWLQDAIFNAYKTGKIMIAHDESIPEITEDIIEVT